MFLPDFITAKVCYENQGFFFWFFLYCQKPWKIVPKLEILSFGLLSDGYFKYTMNLYELIFITRGRFLEVGEKKLSEKLLFGWVCISNLQNL